MRKHFLGIVGMVACLAVGAHAQVFDFTTWGVGARSLAMGRAQTAVAQDISAIYYNAAALARLEKFEFLGNYTTLYESSSYGFIGFAGPTKYGSAGLGVLDMGTAGIPQTDLLGKRLPEFDIRTTGFFFAFAADMNKVFLRTDVLNWSAGVSGKFIKQQLLDVSGNLFMTDLGNLVTFNFEPYKVMLGLNLQNLVGTPMSMIRDEWLPVVMRFGSGVSVLNDRVIFTMDIVQSANYYESNIGVEFNPWKMFSLRAGWNATEYSLGFGLTQKDMQINYGLLINRGWNDLNLGILHTVDVRIKWILFQPKS